MTSRTTPSAEAEALREATPWQDMATAPHGVPIVVKHKPNDAMPFGWVATITRADPEAEEGRFGHPDTILHYNGEALMGRFYGCWEGWMTVEEAVALADRADLEARLAQVTGERDEARAQHRIRQLGEYACEDTLAECRAEVERLRDALKPLAARADAPGADRVGDDAHVTMFMLDCRAARAALAQGGDDATRT